MTAATVRKYHKKSIPWLTKEAQYWFNRYIRFRDTLDGYFICISCGLPKPLDQMNASHFWAAGNYNSVRFDEENAHGGCIQCNKYDHGNLLNYRRRLVEKIGEDRVNALEARAWMSNYKLERLFLISVIDTYKGKCAAIEG